MATMGSSGLPLKKKEEKKDPEGLALLKERLSKPKPVGAKLSPELKAKVNADRLENGKKRGPKVLARAVKLVARDLGVSPDEVMAMIK